MTETQAGRAGDGIPSGWHVEGRPSSASLTTPTGETWTVWAANSGGDAIQDVVHQFLRALAAAPAVSAPAVPLTDELLKEAAENWREYGDGPGLEMSRRKAALMAYKAGARFAEQQHGIKAIPAPGAAQEQQP